MRKIMAICAAAVMLAACCGGGSFKIKGNVDGLTADSVELLLNDEVIASAVVKDGKFVLKGKVEEPARAMLCVDQQPFAVVYLDGCSIKVTGNWEDRMVVSGTKANDAFNAYTTAYNDLFQRYMAAETDQEKEAISDESDALSEKAIDDNMDNLFGLTMLANNTYSLSGDEIIAKLEKFPTKIQNTKLGKDLRENAEAKMNSEPGHAYIEVILPDKDGKEIKLSDYVGKGYILVDFWASWCGPCMAELPYLLESYAKYHDKGFEIFGISLDRSKEEWLAAIAEHKMDWVQTARLMNPETTATKDYSVAAIPSNFLIAPDGTIIAKNLRGEEVATKLAELL